MRHWWVNHKQTVRQEVTGGYLWSPKQEASGARSQFYDNMTLTAPGERVLSYAGGVVGHVGLITGKAKSVTKPREFKDVGSYWDNEGWLVTVDWAKLVRVFSPKDQIEAIRPFLPTKYSPLNPKTGYGNQKAYLAEISAELFKLVDTHGSVAVD